MGFVMFNQATVSRMPPQSVNSARGSYSRLLRSRRRIEEEMGRLDPLLASPKQHGSSRSKQRCSASGKELACRFRRRKKRGFDPWGRKSPWRKKMQPTPVFWSGESHGQRSLEGYSLWGHKQLETTEPLSLSIVSPINNSNNEFFYLIHYTWFYLFILYHRLNQQIRVIGGSRAEEMFSKQNL